MAGSFHNGLIKQRPKWNRLLRMDCGLREEIKGDQAISLGKRSASAF